MKRIFQHIVVASLATTATADFMGLSFEFFQVDENLYTMRIYADFTAETDQLNAVFGDSQSLLYIRSTSEFYQNPFGGPTSASINPALIPIFPSLAYDSWVTIGSEDQVGNQMLDIGIDWTEFESGGDIETDNGTWFATPDDPQVLAGSDLRVLVAQLTTYGLGSEGHAIISGVINLQGKQGDFETFIARDIYFGWIPAPATILLFSFACLVQRRRR